MGLSDDGWGEYGKDLVRHVYIRGGRGDGRGGVGEGATPPGASVVVEAAVVVMH